MSKRSIATRVFQIVFASNVLILFTLLLASWMALEDLETAFIETEKTAELGYFEKYGDKTKPLRLQTDQIVSVFIPHGLEKKIELPLILENITVPFEGEVELLGKEYLVIAHAFPEGSYYFAKNLNLFELHEEKAVIFMIGLALTIMFLSLILAFAASRVIARPVEKITRNIKDLKTNDFANRLNQNFTDKELNIISHAINELLNEIEDVFKRERSMIAMASHELRTPISVILGAANVIENRNQLADNDLITLKRIISSSQDMSTTIQSLLDLVRKTKSETLKQTIDVRDLLQQLQQDYSLHPTKNATRLHINTDNFHKELVGDPTLVKILLQNIINNALDHTDGNVNIVADNKSITISDEGIANTNKHSDSDINSSTGLGMYIVALICDHINWNYEIKSLNNAGTAVTLYFKK